MCSIDRIKQKESLSASLNQNAYELITSKHGAVEQRWTSVGTPFRLHLNQNACQLMTLKHYFFYQFWSCVQSHARDQDKCAKKWHCPMVLGWNALFGWCFLVVVEKGVGFYFRVSFLRLLSQNTFAVTTVHILVVIHIEHISILNIPLRYISVLHLQWWILWSVNYIYSLRLWTLSIVQNSKWIENVLFQKLDPCPSSDQGRETSRCFPVI